MGYYRPRPTEVKHCKHCGLDFQTNHKRAIYCGESCRQLAYKARQGATGKKPEKVLPKLETAQKTGFTTKEIITSAAGSAVALIGNYHLNDKRVFKLIIEKLNTIEQGTEYGFNQLLNAEQLMIDFINAQCQINPDLKFEIERIQRKRLLKR